MTLELNEVLIPGESRPLSLLADEGLLTCITGGSAALRTRWLHVLMGFETPSAGYVSIDGEPLHEGGSIAHLRRHIAFAPAGLYTVGQIVAYEPPSCSDIFALRANRRLAVSPEVLAAEAARAIGAATPLPLPPDASLHNAPTSSPDTFPPIGDRAKAFLLAAAVLREKPVLLVDSPSAASAAYLRDLATRKGRTVIVASADEAIIAQADNVVEASGQTH